MILGFKTEIKGRPTYFVQKILRSKFWIYQNLNVNVENNMDFIYEMDI